MLGEGQVIFLASNLEFVEYVCAQISAAGDITYMKMFGEYGVYCDGKVIGVICDNQFFVKKTEAGAPSVRTTGRPRPTPALSRIS